VKVIPGGSTFIPVHEHVCFSGKPGRTRLGTGLQKMALKKQKSYRNEEIEAVLTKENLISCRALRQFGKLSKLHYCSGLFPQ
jgi:hypothetical protein